MRNVSTWDTTVSSGLVIKEAAYEATITLHTDYFITPDWAKMDAACADQACIWYFKRCQDQQDAKMFECTYYFSKPGDSQNSVVRIDSLNQAGVEQAEMDIGVLAGPEGGTQEVLLSAFTKASDSPGPPYCGRGLPGRACWPYGWR